MRIVPSVTTTLPATFTNVYSSIIMPRCIGCHKPASSGVNVGLLDMSGNAWEWTRSPPEPKAQGPKPQP